MRAGEFDLVGAIEAIYRVEQSTEHWLIGMLETLRPFLDDGSGLYAHTYRIDSALHLRDATFAQLGCSEAVQSAMQPIVLNQGPAFVRDSFLSPLFVRATSTIPSWRESAAARAARSLGVHDCWGINARNFDRSGVVIITNRSRAQPIPRNLAKVMKRTAAHLAAAARLRRRLNECATEDGDIAAVVNPNGRIEHAVGDAKTKTSLAALSRGTVARETARGKLRRDDPFGALECWKGRVAARWTLVDSFEKDGKRYIVARENTQPVAADAELSVRERQVLASAALGRTNKEIGYELGIGHSTVRVFLARAAEKLNARTRDELLSRFAEIVAAGPLEERKG
ncbi:MAG TPA: helix-turn-helix transcriptional regulator [Polyangiaceae bacterium]|nr:helix-turn-helix transcriptional regulator [Polyangiaceae bacterium]